MFWIAVPLKDSNWQIHGTDKCSQLLLMVILDDTKFRIIQMDSW